jgi:2-polyprenyl-3-methyl-5-hydroxy-6-metoxy-1,4-benzoquinol methylase
MDHIQGEADKYPRYGASLWHHDKPIITSDNCDGWPEHVYRYPFNDVWEWLRTTVNPMHGDWYHNSVAYILVYAAFIGVKELRIFGADYSNHNNGVVESGHPNVAYWVGKLECTGLVVRTTEDSAFLNSNQRSWIYGYREDPRTIPNNRKRFYDLVGKTPTTALELLSGERQVAPVVENIQPDHRFRYKWAADRVNGQVLDIGCGIGYGSAILADAAMTESVLAIDRSQESLEYALQHYGRHNLSWARFNLNEPMNWGNEYYDWAVAFEIIEHLPDPAPLLAGLPANKLLLSVPNEEVIPYSPETAPHHHRHYNQHELTNLLAQGGWLILGWYGQLSPVSAVEKFDHEKSRTIVVEAARTRKPYVETGAESNA